MAWKVELDPAAERELGKTDQQTARRILAFLHGRVAQLDDPRSIGEALNGSKPGAFWDVPRRRLANHRQHRGWRVAHPRRAHRQS